MEQASCLFPALEAASCRLSIIRGRKDTHPTNIHAFPHLKASAKERYKPKKKPAPQCHWGSKLLDRQPSVSSATQPSGRTSARQARPPCQVTENELVAQVARK
ncbi:MULTISPECIES: hypothetical protein [unclassified Moorena]|uniref:hypothetical protein n=1 Tax=unclassified Moorena TaxID=2683338 RepID=UPI0013B8C373|nr:MULTISPECIES: hypothetical protein [unclassified Moorena]NEO17281.1 hypothetical protein [Moorena sp. SIO3E8]NEP27243.1 hypothetical protein [Moorena sp. SIO3I6]NEQ03829.1 hypothetical protein [Moorena sp. SIO3F7]NEQ84659.1 hypothetical protein [Moorena sp. SIO2I5]